jgi:hypothetical protein
MTSFLSGRDRVQLPVDACGQGETTREAAISAAGERASNACGRETATDTGIVGGGAVVEKNF